ncbi:MAG TPA: cation transporter [Solirubrobacteraceae bacterium]|nr:cation transporter [Solirubrobacteraceae bacterium]
MNDGARGGSDRPGTADSGLLRVGVPLDPHRQALLQRALRLSWASISFGLVAGSVSVVSGIAEHSLGVLAAGLSVLADVSGSVVLVWRFRTERSDPARAQHVEELAARVVAGTLALIAVALAFESISALLAGSHPGSSALTVVIAAVSIVALMPLAYLKRDTASRLGSHALRGDSTLSAIGATTAVLALVGLLLFDAFGWWWADRAVALVIAAAAVIEARTLLTAEHADD